MRQIERQLDAVVAAIEALDADLAAGTLGLTSIADGAPITSARAGGYS